MGAPYWVQIKLQFSTDFFIDTSLIFMECNKDYNWRFYELIWWCFYQQWQCQFSRLNKVFCQELQFFSVSMEYVIKYETSLVKCLAMPICHSGDLNRLLMPQASAKYQLLPWSDCHNELFYDASALLKCTLNAFLFHFKGEYIHIFHICTYMCRPLRLLCGFTENWLNDDFKIPRFTA